MRRIHAVAAVCATAVAAMIPAAVPALATTHLRHDAARAARGGGDQVDRPCMKGPSVTVSEYQKGRYIYVMTSTCTQSEISKLRADPVALSEAKTEMSATANLLKAKQNQLIYVARYTVTVLTLPPPARVTHPSRRACTHALMTHAPDSGTILRYCSGEVVLNTGFGGMARSVERHHPRR